MTGAGEILLIACYELGHQPLSVAWPAAFLERAGYHPAVMDLSVEPFDADKVRRARLVAMAVPMHTALRLGVAAAARVRAANPDAHICFYGHYAALNGEYLTSHGHADSVLAGELEDALVALARRRADPGPRVSLAKLDFPVPARTALPAEFPALTFDFTAKIEHLLDQRAHLAELAALGALFVVSAAESLDDAVLALLDKGHTRADIEEALAVTRAAGLSLRPTWVAFTPWTTLEGYREWLDFIADERLVDATEPVQYALRLLVPPGSWLLDQPAMRHHLGRLVPDGFHHEWSHPDPRVDALAAEVGAAVAAVADRREDAALTFDRVRALAAAAAGAPAPAPVGLAPDRRRPPRLSEPWFC